MARAHLVLSMTLSLRSPWLSIWWGPLSTKQIGAKHCSLADLVNCALTMFLCMWFWLLHIWWMQRFPFCCWPKAALQRISGLQRLWMMRTLCLPRYGLSFLNITFQQLALDVDGAYATWCQAATDYLGRRLGRSFPPRGHPAKPQIVPAMGTCSYKGPAEPRRLRQGRPAARCLRKCLGMM